MHFVYILKCCDNSTYVGLTQDVKKRIFEHKQRLAHHTKSRLPVKLVWLGVFANKTKAAAFEQYLKTGSGIAFFKKRLV